MREKMARAMLFGEHNVSNAEMTEDDREQYFSGPAGRVALDFVDAALDALIEPTDEMIAATIPALTEPDTFDLDAFPGDIPEAATLAWQAMIRAAKEGK